MNALRRLRLELHLSQCEFAAQLGVAEQTYRTWDSGRRRLPRAVVYRARRFKETEGEDSILVRPLQKRVEQAQLADRFKRGGMDRVAAEVAVASSTECAGISAWISRHRPHALVLGILVCTGEGCSHATQPDCVHVPCPIPLAIMLGVTSAPGGPVPGLTVTVSGSASGLAQCTAGASVTSCTVPGTAGTYNLLLSAAGFQEQALSVVVSGSTPACGCPTVQTQQVNAVLTPR